MDEPITFYALVIPRDQRRELGDLDGKTWTEDEIKALDVGYVRLELLPRGKGELMVRAPLLYHSITEGETVHMAVDLFNEGSHRIDNITFEVELPLSWQKEISPVAVSSLAIGEDQRVEFTFMPPDEVPEGKYDIRLRTSGTSDNQPVQGEDKTITVEVRGQTSIFGASAILVLLIGLVGGVVVFAVRLSKR
jgi:uncharacterized membrane protein